MSIWTYPLRTKSGQNGANSFWYDYGGTASTETTYRGSEVWIDTTGTDDTDWNVTQAWTVPEYYWSGMQRWLLLYVTVGYDNNTTGDSAFASTLSNVTFDGVSGTLVSWDSVQTESGHNYGANIPVFAHYIYGWKDADLPANPSGQSLNFHWETSNQTTATGPWYTMTVLPLSGVDQTTTFADVSLRDSTSHPSQPATPNLFFQAPHIRNRTTLYFFNVHADSTPGWNRTIAAELMIDGITSHNLSSLTQTYWQGNTWIAGVGDPGAERGVGDTIEDHSTDDTTATHVYGLIELDVIPDSNMEMLYKSVGSTITEVDNPAPATGNATVNSTFNYTMVNPSGNDRILIAILHHLCQDDSAGNVTAINLGTTTYNSVAPTGTFNFGLITEAVHNNIGSHAIAYWLDADLPSTTGTYSLSLDSDMTKSTSTGKNTVYVECSEWSGVDQTVPFGYAGGTLPESSIDDANLVDSQTDSTYIDESTLSPLNARGALWASGFQGYETTPSASFHDGIRGGVTLANITEGWGPDRFKAVTFAIFQKCFGGTDDELWASGRLSIDLQHTSGDITPRMAFMLQRHNEPPPPGNPKGVLGHPLHGALAGPVGP